MFLKNLFGCLHTMDYSIDPGRLKPSMGRSVSTHYMQNDDQ